MFGFKNKYEEDYKKILGAIANSVKTNYSNNVMEYIFSNTKYIFDLFDCISATILIAYYSGLPNSNDPVRVYSFLKGYIPWYENQLRDMFRMSYNISIKGTSSYIKTMLFNDINDYILNYTEECTNDNIIYKPQSIMPKKLIANLNIEFNEENWHNIQVVVVSAMKNFENNNYL